MSKWWLDLNHKFLQRILAIARVDPDVSFEQYNKMQKMYDDMYKDVK